MGSYSITYWQPGATSASVMAVNADEFTFTETHALFLAAADDSTSRSVIFAMPLTLQPVIRYTGAAA